MDKWLKRDNDPSRETPNVTTSGRPVIKYAPAGNSDPCCFSKSTLDQDASSSTEVARKASSMATDSKTCIRETDTTNRKESEASYMVSCQAAETGKPQYCGGLNSPCWLGQCWGKNYNGPCLHQTTLFRSISDMAGYSFKQLLVHLRASELWAPQLDESTDVAGLAQLMVYVRYIHEGSIKEDLLFCKPLEIRTGEDIFRMLAPS